MVIQIADAVLQELARHAAAAYPDECCGLLMGTLGTGGELVVRRSMAAANSAEEKPQRYRVEPRDYLAADAVARSAGLDVLGVYHSHPEHPAIPSVTDCAESWEGYVYVIASVMAGRVGEIRAWRMAPGRVVEELAIVRA